MAHLALYRAFRPQDFDEVVGQKQVVYPLRQALMSGEIAHAYLFCGTRGTGKTSLAKIFAKAVNCLQPENGNPCNHCEICEAQNKGTLFDVMELDAASNNSVNNIRDITDKIIYKPAAAKYKVYIIDEVHMLSQGAFNALLKTLEEPPAHAIFILATTEPERLPATILSRCQRYDFRRLAPDEIRSRLAAIAEKENIQIEGPALDLLSRLADGALRDGISLLDQARSGLPQPICRDALLDLVGLLSDQVLSEMLEQILAGEVVPFLSLLDRVLAEGRDPSHVLLELAQLLRDILICQFSADPGLLLTRPADSLAALKALSGRLSTPQALKMIEHCSRLSRELRWSADPRTSLEIGLLEIFPGAQGAPPALQRQSSAQPLTALPQPQATASTPTSTPVQAPKPETATSVRAEDGQTATSEPSPAAVSKSDAKHHGSETEVGAAQAPQTREMDQAKGKPRPVSETPMPSTPSVTSSPLTEVTAETSASTCCAVNTDDWDALLQALRARYRVDLTVLLGPARASLQDGILDLSYNKRDQAHVELLNSKANLTLLQELAASIWPGRHVQIHCDDTATPAPKTQPVDSKSGSDWQSTLIKFARERQIPIEEEN